MTYILLNLQPTLTNAFSTTNGSAEVTITLSNSWYNMNANDIVLLDNFSTITGSNFSASDFDDKKFMVTSVPRHLLLQLQCHRHETGSGATTSGGIRVSSIIIR